MYARLPTHAWSYAPDLGSLCSSGSESDFLTVVHRSRDAYSSVEEALMDDTRHPSPEGQGANRPLQKVELERVLDEGIDDLDAGRTISREQSVREIEELLSSHQKKKKPAS